MIKKTITYTDFNDQERTEDLYFHIKKSDLLDNLDLKTSLQELQDRMTAEGRTEENLTEEEIYMMLRLVKRLLCLSYGIRSEDGLKHRQSPTIWDDFKDSAAYDAVLFQLFQEKGEAMDFLTGVMPKELLAQAEAELAERKAPQDFLPKHVADKPANVETVEAPEEELAPGVIDLTAQAKATREAELRAELAALEG
jgi:hypothetical protein